MHKWNVTLMDACLTHRLSYHKLVFLSFLSVVSVVLGCGGGSIGNSLTGGSVPVGGRNVTGVAVLPNSTPAANAAVEVRSLPSGTLITQTSTDGSGQFTVSSIPTNSDIDVTINVPPSNILEAIVPQATLAAGPGPEVNIGSINATTSIVAATIKLEQMNAPQDAPGIISNETMSLFSAVQGQHFSPNMQNQLIGNRNNMNAQALSLIVPVANAELTTMNQSLTENTAAAALYGLLGYLRAAHSRDFQLPANLRESLTNAEVAGAGYSANSVAIALQQSGLRQATGAQVQTASAKERKQLTALAVSGASLSPFEAFVIAADVSSDGGFQCDQNTLNSFLTDLLGI